MAEKEKVVLAYSGGLDTSVCIKWLQVEKNLDVIAICGNVGQDEKDLEWIRQKALDMGAIASEAVDMRAEYAADFLSKAIWANGKYEGVYPLLSALSRPLISKHLVDLAHKYGAKYVAHGCTGKGNDQVRFETSIRALDPDLEIIAPVREWDLTSRESEMEWAAAHDVPVPTTKKKPYSIDDNLWGRAIECGVLEDTWNTPPADIWTMTAAPEDCPAEPETVIIGFKGGVPSSINGEELPLLDLIIKANEIAGRNGYGRLDMIEDRVVGIKSRECYECPGALLLIEAHKTLETLCLDYETLKEKAKLDVEWASAVYRGLWYSQNRHAIDAYNAYTQKYVTGEVRFKLCRGGIFMDGVRSDYSLYSKPLATYDEGDIFPHEAAPGFIELHSLQSRTWSRMQGPGSGLA
ncbi:MULTISPECIES: argininosuccinate synthase [Collinsella]|uniref:argininosuccinate synthase n=1 Tax=Collinsella TaxID=102106 RepID=UPI000B39FA9A|nr:MULTISPECIES: argininosuccinate synthase [Collinsella]MBM6908804.1 argininosuccinate synthase [Collinsella intestinalis]MBM6943483.1 argininosuccinate synthase [Collinsella intestinalis]OUO65058.1 argininosuccinate synthase [Collinsella sp. An268]